MVLSRELHDREGRVYEIEVCQIEARWWHNQQQGSVTICDSGLFHGPNKLDVHMYICSWSHENPISSAR